MSGVEFNPYEAPSAAAAPPPAHNHRTWRSMWFGFDGRISRSQYWINGVVLRLHAAALVVMFSLPNCTKHDVSKADCKPGPHQVVTSACAMCPDVDSTAAICPHSVAYCIDGQQQCLRRVRCESYLQSLVTVKYCARPTAP